MFVHDQFFLFEYFQSVHLIILWASGQKYLSKRAFTKLFDKPKMSQLQLIIIELFINDKFVIYRFLRLLFLFFFFCLFFSALLSFWNCGSRSLCLGLFHIGALGWLWFLCVKISVQTGFLAFEVLFGSRWVFLFFFLVCLNVIKSIFKSLNVLVGQFPWTLATSRYVPHVQNYLMVSHQI